MLLLIFHLQCVYWNGFSKRENQDIPVLLVCGILSDKKGAAWRLLLCTCKTMAQYVISKYIVICKQKTNRWLFCAPQPIEILAVIPAEIFP